MIALLLLSLPYLHVLVLLFLQLLRHGQVALFLLRGGELGRGGRGSGGPARALEAPPLAAARRGEA